MPQRPKTETYEGQVLVITRMVRLSEDNAIDMEQVSILMGENYVLTFQERYGDVLGSGSPADPSLAKVVRFAAVASDYLSYAIIDTIIDGYYPVIEAIGDHLEQLEEVVMDNPSTRNAAGIEPDQELCWSTCGAWFGLIASSSVR